MSTYGWALEAWTAVSQALLDRLGESGAGEPEIRIYTSGNALLAAIELSLDDSEVDVDGNLVLEPASATFTPTASGEADHATLVDGDATVLQKMPCVESSVAVAGSFALADLTLTELVPVDVISLVIPAGDTLD